jgi:MoxR-like ATPase
MTSVMEKTPSTTSHRSVGADDSLKSRLIRVRDALGQNLIERDIPIRLAFLSALAGEHVLLIGPPGTAKSELARRLRLVFTGQTYFERLLTRFSVPEELFGPLSIKALEEDKYQRQTEGYLPTAAVAFLDEIFKANSAILNALLTLLNEREFDNGTQRIKTPLVSVVGASNELPQEEELLALYDRFLVRYHVGPVTDEGFSKLLDLRGHTTPNITAADRLTPLDIEQIYAAALKVTVPPEVGTLLKAMRLFCRDQQIPVSDRRWRKALFLLQVAAHTDGRAAVSVWDCWLLQHCLWHKPEERPKLAKWYEDVAGSASPREPERFKKIAIAWEQRLKHDESTKVQKVNEKGQSVFESASGSEVVSPKSKRKVRDQWGHEREEEVQNAPVMVTMAYTTGHIKHQVDSVEMTIREVNQFLTWSNQQVKQLEESIRGHIWVDPAFAVPAARNLEDHIKQSSKVLARLEKTKKGFQELPVKSDVESTDHDSEVESRDAIDLEWEAGDEVRVEISGRSYQGTIVRVTDSGARVRFGDNGAESDYPLDDLSPVDTDRLTKRHRSRTL